MAVTSADALAALEAVTLARARLAEAEADLRDAVEDARNAGASWERVGVALGVTKQTAWEKFGPCYR